jgi:hypothetical protein
MDSLLTKFGQKKVNTGLPGLMDLDLKIIYSMPTISEYKKISTRIKELSDDYVRMLDSVDYFRSGKDTLIVTVYSQNYAYHSGNSYKLQINSNNDSLKLYYIFYDMAIKKDIEDYFDFMGRKFEYKVLYKEIGDMKKTKRTIIIKKYL